MNKNNGKVVMDLAPTKGNPRNSEGAFIELNDGRLMFVYSRFIGDSDNDDASACIAARYSSDGGNSWSEQDWIIAKPEALNALNLMSVSLVRMRNDDIGLFYIIRNGFHDTRLHLSRSSDEGVSWTLPECCIPGLGYYVTNNDRVVQLSSGRLIVPAALHKLRSENVLDFVAFDGRGSVYFIISDDDGVSWREAKNGCTLSSPYTSSGLQEPGLIELQNGVLWAWSRTDMGRQYEMFSFDQGETWTDARPSRFTSPASPLSMKRNKKNNELLAVWNPIPDYETRSVKGASWGRTPLIGAISNNEGKSWHKHFAIETDEERGFCYTAMYFTKDSLLMAYCAGGPEDRICLSRLRMRKWMLEHIW